MYDLQQRLVAGENHKSAEGLGVTSRTVLESYDRVLHPWIHGRRPADIARRLREWWA